jgi:hypothetical protein
VSLGDSYISGEGGRWLGNSNNPTGNRSGTDRACVPAPLIGCSSYDANRVYGATNATGCHRSDVAEILYNTIPAQLKVNFACSGAATDNVYRSSQGGQPYKGEIPQADHLTALARAFSVRGIVLSIGGNDVGFADVVQACITAYLSLQTPCNAAQQAALDQRLPVMRQKVAKAVDEVRAAMSAAGYAQSSYRLIVQSYPSVAPRASETRYGELARVGRTLVGGCPFYNADLNWARDSAVRQIAATLRSAVSGKGVQFLDLQDAFQGREICSTSSELAMATRPPAAERSEWGRFVQLVNGAVVQGELQEVFHPNAYGQRAIGTCLSLIWAQSGPGYACTNTPGQGTGGMRLTPLS